jgi:hypothetical protein
VFELGWSSLYGPLNSLFILLCMCITTYQEPELWINVRMCLTAGLNRLFLLKSVFPGHSVIAILGELVFCTLCMQTTSSEPATCVGLMQHDKGSSPPSPVTSRSNTCCTSACIELNLCVIIWVAEVDLSMISRGSKSSRAQQSHQSERVSKRKTGNRLPISVAVTRNTPSVAFHMVALPRVRPE